MTTHATIDIETLGSYPDTVVLTIGGIKFDPMADDGLHSQFYYRLNADEQIEKGRTITETTLEWWDKQDEEVKKEDRKISLATVYNNLKQFIKIGIIVQKTFIY